MKIHPGFSCVQCLPYQLINGGEINQFVPTAVVILGGPQRWKLFSFA